jgi:hypothetical protein
MKLIILFLLLWNAQFAFSQDTIIFRNGVVDAVKIQEISDRKITYKLYAQPDGPLYEVSKLKISSYSIEGGQRETFHSAFDEAGISKNYLSTNPADLFWDNLSFSYERLVNERNDIGIYTPVRISFDRTDNPEWKQSSGRNIFAAGIGAKFYAINGLRFKLFFGPEIEYGLRKTAVYKKVPKPEDTYNPIPGTPGDFIMVVDRYANSHMLGYYCVTGFRYLIQPNIGVHLSGGLGFYDDLFGVKSYLAKKADVGFFFAF